MPSAAGREHQAQPGQPPGPEWLYSNLIKVTFPEEIGVADTQHRVPATVWGALRQAGGDVGPEWLLVGKRLLSFRDLRTPPWDLVCDGRTARRVPTSEWAGSDDHDRTREFVRLLNHCLRALGDSLGLRYSRQLECFYFPPTPNLKPRNLTYRSFQRETDRDVFTVAYRKNDPDAVWYCRHIAFLGAFQRYAGEWYLEVTPTYVFTSDGVHLSRSHADLLAGIKRFEGNAAVAGQVVMWGDFLARKGDLFRPEYEYLRLGKVERFEVGRGIDDAAWQAQDSTEQPSEGGEDPSPAEE